MCFLETQIMYQTERNLPKIGKWICQAMDYCLVATQSLRYWKWLFLSYKWSVQGTRVLVPGRIQSSPSPSIFPKPPLLVSVAYGYLALCNQSPRTFEVGRPEFTKTSCLGHFLKYKPLEDMTYPNRKEKYLTNLQKSL